MEQIKVRIEDYNKPEYYSVIPPEIFDAFELAELKAALSEEEAFADVPKDLFEKMLEDIQELTLDI